MSDEIKRQINDLKTEVKRALETETRKTTEMFSSIKSYFERSKQDLKSLNHHFGEVKNDLKEVKNDIRDIKNDIRDIKDKANQ